jgi:ribosomal protein S18 acetylase RimI-like enzyme
VDIRDLSDGPEELVLAIGHLLDAAATSDATRRFVDERGHHLLVAYEHELAIGFVTGVETTHPDKGTEMFLYELGVDDSARGKGVGRALVAALAQKASAVGCYGMWVLTDRDNTAAIRTYQAAGALDDNTPTVLLSWTFDHE